MLKPLHLSHAANAVDGGIATAVSDLIAAQQAAGLDSQWLTADHFSPIHRDRELAINVQTYSPGLVHVHGLWRSPTRIASRLDRAGLPLLIAPHGMLDTGALAISRGKKQLVWHLWERRALQSARCLHALCPSEADSIRNLLPRALIAVIPNGVELPSLVNASTVSSLPEPPWAHVIPADAPVLLFFGRFHAKKGLKPLLQAWQAVAAHAECSGWWLAIVGYGDDGALKRHVAAGQARGELTQLYVGEPAFGADKDAVLSGASAFVLPSFSEGLPMAALEAMAHQLPCLLSSSCNLPEAFRAGAALAAEPHPMALATALQQLFVLSPAERAAFGAAGHALVTERYSWGKVAVQTKQLYNWILGGAEQPSFVQSPF